MRDTTTIILAHYQDPRLADAHADLLRQHQISCHLDIVDHVDSLTNTGGWQAGDVLLRVDPDDAEEALNLLDATGYHTGASDTISTAQSYMMIGVIMTIVGLLTSFGEFHGFDHTFVLFPFGLAILGGCLFFKGYLLHRSV
ncbi:MAG: hypothetical protein OHK0039_31430 [Bacteroidia bacterium]